MSHIFPVNNVFREDIVPESGTGKAYFPVRRKPKTIAIKRREQWNRGNRIITALELGRMIKTKDGERGETLSRQPLTG